MRPFNSLTTLGQARRLRELAMVALEGYDFDVARLRLLSADYNGVFRVDTTDGDKYVLRICTPEPHRTDALAAETAWLEELDRDTELGVPVPIPMEDGELSAFVEVDGVPEPRLCVLFSWVPGPDLRYRSSEKTWRSLGRYMANLHIHGRQFAFPKDIFVRTYDKVFPFVEPEVLPQEDVLAQLSKPMQSLIPATIEAVQDVIDRVSEDAPLQAIHGDLHHWNAKVYRGRIAAIDFEDVMLGYPVQDLAITLYYIQHHDKRETLRRALQEGYASVKPWPELREGDVDTLIAGRSLVLLNVLVQTERQNFLNDLDGFLARSERLIQTISETGRWP